MRSTSALAGSRCRPGLPLHELREELTRVCLLLVAFDDARVSSGGGIRIEASLAQRASLPKQVPALIERDPELAKSFEIGRTSCAR